MPATYTTPSGEVHLSKEAFSRFCERCDDLLEGLGEISDGSRQAPGKMYTGEVPFASWNELLDSASKGDCHFCCSLVTQSLAQLSRFHRARPVTGEGLTVTEQNYPALVPIVSEDGLLKIEITPAVDTSGLMEYLVHFTIPRADLLLHFGPVNGSWILLTPPVGIGMNEGKSY